MEWKQPEGLRRHWVLEAIDAELLFPGTPAGAAHGRVGENDYDLRDGGVLRKKRTLSSEGAVLATLEQMGAGAGSVLRHAGREYTWKPTSPLAARWALLDDRGKVAFAFSFKQGLANAARVETGDGAAEEMGLLMVLCWYSIVVEL